MPGEDHDPRGGKPQRCLGALNFLAVVAFWSALVAAFVVFACLGLGTFGWRALRHEMRRGKPK